MPRYFFHIRYRDGLVLDPEGVEFPSIDFAREEAISSAREILAHASSRVTARGREFRDHN